MVLVSFLLQGLGLGLTAAAQPGPFQAYIISESLSRGWRRTLPAALAPLLSDGPIIVAALLLLSHLPTGWERLLNLIGGGFVLYLAWGAFRAWRSFSVAPETSAHTAPTSFFRAATMNFLGPGPYLYWAFVSGPVLLAAWRARSIYGVVFLVSFYVMIVSSNAAIVWLFGHASRLGPKVQRALMGVSVIALVAFGLYQLWQGLV